MLFTNSYFRTKGAEVKKSVRDVREKLYRESVRLRELSNTTPGNKGFEIRDNQGIIYRKWKFYDSIIKADDKIKGDK